jgi:hypothetical protein
MPDLTAALRDGIEPGILRDTVRCPACAATVPVSQRKLDILAEVLGEVRP